MDCNICKISEEVGKYWSRLSPKRKIVYGAVVGLTAIAGLFGTYYHYNKFYKTPASNKTEKSNRTTQSGIYTPAPAQTEFASVPTLTIPPETNAPPETVAPIEMPIPAGSPSVNSLTNSLVEENKTKEKTLSEIIYGLRENPNVSDAVLLKRGVKYENGTYKDRIDGLAVIIDKNTNDMETYKITCSHYYPDEKLFDVRIIESPLQYSKELNKTIATIELFSSLSDKPSNFSVKKLDNGKFEVYLFGNPGIVDSAVIGNIISSSGEVLPQPVVSNDLGKMAKYSCGSNGATSASSGTTRGGGDEVGY